MAVSALFVYCLRLLYELGLQQDGIILVGHLQSSLGPLALKAEVDFAESFAIYELAVYSRSGPSVEQRAFVYEFMCRLLLETRERRQGLQAFKSRFIACLY